MIPRLSHPRVKRAFVSTRLEPPDRTPHRVLVVETDMPIAETDPSELGALLDGAKAVMELTGAEKIELKHVEPVT